MTTPKTDGTEIESHVSVGCIYINIDEQQIEGEGYPLNSREQQVLSIMMIS